MNILDGLNEKQIEAVTHKDGPLLVIAGPGTGKTKVVTHRIAYLIVKHKVAAAEILAITFTNKAAREMQERISNEIDEQKGSNVQVTTFHSFCVEILRAYAPRIGLSENFTIFDQEIQDEILTEVVNELILNPDDYPPWKLRNIISNAKCKLQNPTDVPDVYQEDAADIDDPEAAINIENTLRAYQHKLTEYNALDFDDLLVKTVTLLEQVPEVQQTYHKNISHILVDEYHDVNEAQYRLLQLLCAPPERNLMVVADADQAIYSWRGSNQRYIEEFKAGSMFRKSGLMFIPKIIELDSHYRCSKNILHSAEEIISKNTERENRSLLKTRNDVGKEIFHYTFDRPLTEARGIIQVIQNLVKEPNYSYGDIAIFYRTHKLAEVLEEQLLRTSIKFHRIRPTNLFSEDNNKGIRSYLRFIQWQLLLDLESAINFPETCIDNLTWVRLKWLAQREGIAFIELLKNIEAYPEYVGPLTQRNVRQFWTQLEKLSTEFEGEKIDKIVLKLFDALEFSRSPYRAEELEIIEKQPELPNLTTAQDVLYRAINLNEPIQITVSYGIDEYCAAHIIYQTLKTYLNHTAQLHFLSSSQVKPRQSEKGVHLLIGDFGEIEEKSANIQTILIGTATTNDTNVIRLGAEGVRSIAMLKLCQRLINRFESPNMANMVVYDLETTGLNPKTAEIVEIAAQCLNATGDKIEHYYQLVKPPGGQIPEPARRIHGISTETVAAAPSIEIVLPGFWEFIRNRILIGHNVAEYDNLILARDLRDHLDNRLSNPYYDTLITARRLFPRQRCSIGALAEKFEIEHGPLHEAAEDVEVNRKIFRELIKTDAQKREVKSLTEFLPFVGVSILSKTAVSDIGEPFTETGVLLNAAKRFIQTRHTLARNDYDPLLQIEETPLSLESTEKEQIETLIRQLHQSNFPIFQEDTDWIACKLKFLKFSEKFRDESNLIKFLDYLELLTGSDEIDDQGERTMLIQKLRASFDEISDKSEQLTLIQKLFANFDEIFGEIDDESKQFTLIQKLQKLRISFDEVDDKSKQTMLIQELLTDFNELNDKNEQFTLIQKLIQKLLTSFNEIFDEIDNKNEQITLIQELIQKLLISFVKPLTLMTLHTAKGTEFKIAFIIGMEEGSFPMWKQNITPEEIEEERRLFYVGMTRAQERLYLSSTVYRFNDRDRPASMFIREIPADYIKKWVSPLCF